MAKLRITVNSKDVSQGLSDISNDMPRILMACVVQATTILYRNSREQMSEKIYNVPIPIRKRSGKPAWIRTSNLLNNEQVTYRQLRNGAYGLIHNEAKNKKDGGEYAYWRHQLNAKSPLDGINRHAPWRDLAIATKGDKAIGVFRKKLGNEIDARWK
jgi:hypothetical protein